DKNLGAGFARAVEEQHACAGVGAAGKDGRREAGGAGADDGDVSAGGDAGHWPSLRATIMTAYTAAVSLIFHEGFELGRLRRATGRACRLVPQAPCDRRAM